MSDNFEIVDREYGESKEVKVARPIKTRKTSYDSIIDNFTKEVLKLRLSMMENKALYEKYDASLPYKKVQSKVDKSAKAIARLEEKILVLSRDDVPSNYVESRAIKLRDAMMTNLTKNASDAYMGTQSIGLENRDEIFGNFENEYNENVVPKVEESEESVLEKDDLTIKVPKIVESTESSDVVPEVEESGESVLENADSTIEVPKIAESTESSDAVPEVSEEDSVLDNENVLDNDGVLFEVNPPIDNNENEEDKIIDVVPTPIERQNIEDVISNEFDNVAVDENNDSAFVSPEEVRNVVEAGINDSEDNNELSEDDVNNIVDSAFDNIDDDEKVDNDNYRVSQNESTVVHDDRFDENGERIVPEEDLNEEEIDSIKQEVRKAISDVINRKSDGGKIVVDGNQLRQDIEDNIVESTDMGRDSVSREVQRIIDQDRNEKSGYVPLTDEEVEKARRNLGISDNEQSSISKLNLPVVVPLKFDEVAEDMKSKVQLRDVPVIVPDRTPLNDKLKTYEEVDNYEFEDEKTNTKSQLDSYSDLKNKLENLLKHKKAVEQAKNAAQKAAEDMADKARQARELAEKSEKQRIEQLERLRSYTDSLEEACKNDEKSIELAENDAMMNNNFIETQLRKVEENNSVIDEIDSLIGNKVR